MNTESGLQHGSATMQALHTLNVKARKESYAPVTAIAYATPCSGLVGIAGSKSWSKSGSPTTDETWPLPEQLEPSLSQKPAAQHRQSGHGHESRRRPTKRSHPQRSKTGGERKCLQWYHGPPPAVVGAAIVVGL